MPSILARDVHISSYSGPSGSAAAAAVCAHAVLSQRRVHMPSSDKLNSRPGNGLQCLECRYVLIKALRMMCPLSGLKDARNASRVVLVP